MPKYCTTISMIKLRLFDNQKKKLNYPIFYECTILKYLSET